MIRAVLIDDEDKAVKNLASLLGEFCPDIEIAGTASTLTDAKKAVSTHSPDLVFLDIEMPEANGFELLEQLGDVDFELIFITAYHQYAIKAFKFSAVDYLLKPINILELQSAVKRVVRRKAKHQTKDKLEVLLQNLRPNRPINKIALPTEDGLLFIQLDDIIQAESLDNYTRFFLKGGKKILVSKTIKHFEELLSGHQFFRVHRSHLINLNHIKKYVKGEGGYTIMSDESTIMVSRRKKEPFLKVFSKI